MKKRIAMLWLIRECQPISLNGIIIKLKGEPVHSYPQGVQNFISKLVSWGLESRGLTKMQKYCRDLLDKGFIETTTSENITFKKINILQKDILNIPLRSTENLDDMLKFFDISLTGLVDKPGYGRMLYPVFGKPLHPDYHWTQVFVAMPFREELKPIYDDNISPVAQELGLTYRRGDNFNNSNMIMNDVWNSIVHARVCIVDCTGQNPNVFYELGITHTVGTSTILISQNPDDIPFNIKHMRFIIYDIHEMDQFRVKLKETLQTILNI